MKRFFSKPYTWAVTFSLVLALSCSLILLDTFVIPKAMVQAESQVTETQGESVSAVNGNDEETGDTSRIATVTGDSYMDDNISIKIETLRVSGTTVYVAEVEVSDLSYLQAAFAEDTYGRNIKETTSEIAAANDAVFAINGDYYGFSDLGYVLRNGTLYRADGDGTEDLVIEGDGTFSIIEEDETSLESLEEAGVWQVFSFGPALISDGSIVVSESTEVAKSMTSNPRTAIGMISPLHYVFVVSDGRTEESAGLTLYELAQVMEDYGCTVAYNLDGGGSSTMYFNGEVINNPTDGHSDGEREVSDIVYIGY